MKQNQVTMHVNAEDIFGPCHFHFGLCPVTLQFHGRQGIALRDHIDEIIVAFQSGCW